MSVSPSAAGVATHRRRRAMTIALVSMPLAGLSRWALAQADRKRWRIGFLMPDAPSAEARTGLLEGLRELGLVQGRDFEVEWRFAEGRYERLPSLADALVRGNVHIIVAGTSLAAQAARQATAKLPIVMVGVPDPVGEGFAASLSRPGRNMTGLSNIVNELSVKQLELLLGVVPAKRVAVLLNPLNPSDALMLEQIQGAAYARGVAIVPLEASSEADFDKAFATMLRERCQAAIVAADPWFDVNAKRIADLALRHRMPTVFSSRAATKAGGLMSYGPSVAENYRKAASYVDRIMKGGAPGDLPIERPTAFDLVVNPATARALGLTLPAELMMRAEVE